MRAPSTALVFALLLLWSQAAGQISRVSLRPSFPVLQAGNAIWIGTPEGLFQYNQSDDSFIKFALPGRNKDAGVRLLYLHKEWLWCVLDTGVAALHVRLNDWLYFDSTSSFPSHHVRRLDFQDDYVWAATDNGLARFDMLIEQWEVIGRSRGLPDQQVADVRVLGSSAWLLNGGNLSEYNPQFEKWRHFPLQTDSTGALLTSYLLDDEIWVVAEKGLLRFDPKLQRSQPFLFPYLSSGSLVELYTENRRVWAVTHQGIFFYERDASVWREFEGNSGLESFTIRFGEVNAQQIWVLADETTLLWDRTAKTWSILDYSTGLSAGSYSSVASDGELTFLFNDRELEYRRSSREPWRRHTVGGITGEGAGPLARMFDNPEGGSIAVGSSTWGWQGTRIAWLQDWSVKYPDDGAQVNSTSAVWRFDVKSQLLFGKGRRATGFYNNVDYEETKYGAWFRGNDSDFVREVAWGDFQKEQGYSPFGQSVELFGGALWLEEGPRTERFRRSLIAAKGASGEMRSRHGYEHFSGVTRGLQRTVSDVEYAKDQFFAIPGLDSTARPEAVELFVDNGIASDNTPRTLSGVTVAGVRGDFDAWVPVEHFAYDPRIASLRLLRPVFPGWVVAARYTLGGLVREVILQDSTFSAARVNVYSLGAQQIIPYTARLTIYDTTGREVPLSDFGVDKNADGIWDDPWIDFEMGLLWFPQERPFPPVVYAPGAAQSVYRIGLQGETRFPVVQLGRRNLVRGSEVVKLDAVVAAAGNDYALDYTNGTLIFVREDAVNPDTRIEVEYDYYEATGERLNAAGVSFSPSDNLSVRSDWQQRENDSTHSIALHAEVRQQVGEFDVRLVPGVVYQTREQGITAGSAEALVSSSWLRLQSRYDRYAPDYSSLHTIQSVVGEVRERLNLFGSVDIREDLRLTGEWNKLRGDDLPAGAPTDEIAAASVLYNSRDLPGVRVTYQTVNTVAGDSNVSKELVQGLLEYQLPVSWMEAAGMRGMKLEYSLRKGRQSAARPGEFREEGFQQTYYKANVQIQDQFQAGFFYRHNTVDDLGGGPVSGYDRLLFDVSYGEWRVAQLNFRLENSLQQDLHRNSPTTGYSLRQFHQLNVRLSPGQIWMSLSTLFFEVNYNLLAGQTGLNEGSMGSALWSFGPPDEGYTGSRYLGMNYFVKNEFRPDAFWLFTTLFEWGDQETVVGTTRLEPRLWQFTEKADIRIGYATRLTGQYRQSFQDAGADRTVSVLEPSIWLEQRWTEDVLSTVQVLYRRTESDNTSAVGIATDWGGYLDVTVRKDSWALMRRVEFRQSVSANHRRSDDFPLQRNSLLGTATSLDLYPVRSLIVRLRLDWNRYADAISPGRGYDALLASLKLSLQL